CPRLPIVLCLQHIIHAEGMKLCRPYRTECFIRGLIPGAAPDGLPQAIELSCAFSADLVSWTPRRTAGNLARPMLVRQTMKLCRPYRAESFTRGLIPGAAPDGLPQAIELSCAFSADRVSRTPRWDRRESCPPDARATNNEIVPSLQDGVFYLQHKINRKDPPPLGHGFAFALGCQLSCAYSTKSTRKAGNCAAPTGRNVLLGALYLGRRLPACPRLLNCPAPSAQISCPGRLAGNAGILARPMLVRQARGTEGELCSSPRSTALP